MHQTARKPTPLLIVFMDLTRFTTVAQRVDATELADGVDAYYARVAAAVRSAGGTTVKFIGDATLAVFPEGAIDSGVRMLLELKPAVDRMMADQGWESRLMIKAHFGEVIAGEFGPVGETRFDILGRAANTAATLESSGVTLSAEAFRRLSPDLRRSFRKHTGPVTYIRHDDPRPFRRKGG